MKAQYQACRYKGTQWGVWSNASRNWMVFGTRAAMEARAKELNREARK
jgi:hypothetical protein